MSTIAYVRFKVDMRLRQFDTKNRTFSVPEVDQAIREKYIAKKAMMPQPHVAESSAFTIGAGGDTFTPTLAGTTYSDADDVRLRLQSNGRFLFRVTPDELDAMRNAQPTVFLSVPTHFALWEDHQGVLRGSCYPGALAAQVVDMFRSRSHAAPTSATDLDSAAVYFNEASCNALAQSVAADFLVLMTDKEAERRNLRRDIAPSWQREAEKLLYQEDARRADIMSSGRVQRWVS